MLATANIPGVYASVPVTPMGPIRAAARPLLQGRLPRPHAVCRAGPRELPGPRRCRALVSIRAPNRFGFVLTRTVCSHWAFSRHPTVALR